MKNSNLPDSQSCDHGPSPCVLNIAKATLQNQNYRTTLWTGQHLQLTVMCIPVGGDVGLEKHDDVDQFFRVEQGCGIVKMGKTEKNLSFQACITNDSVIFVPAGTWHNVINTGNVPLKLYTIYSPPNHPKGTIHTTKCDAMKDEH